MSWIKDLPSYTVPILTLTVIFTVGVLIFVLFARQPTSLTIEILAAIIALVLVVASVCITIHYQHISDMNREFNVQLFEKKLALYMSFIDAVTKADDRGQISKQAMMEILNVARSVALVGQTALVSTMHEFIREVIANKTVLVNEDKRESQFSALLTQMRDDLSVADDSEGGAQDQIRELMKLASEIHKVEE